MGTTILEVHLHDGLSFSSNMPFRGDVDETTTIDEGESDEMDEESSGGMSGMSMLVGLLFVVGVAALARRLLGDGDQIAELDDFADDVAEASA